ncbi:hypothetical protein Bsp3421_006207 [Burkholderia sp. FERM BP-3421]|jgi:hypothetical protein|uniref:hypothetical protein n=1 Tax=Burkholderia sp. FERM BP-3421 TaxID=1494466 RepID=UPI002361DCDC|nr:hypothetical protein [Burkholderia sp. FERM BP-3421]WDD96023.1 hypothetical protein Bsp3421_006207 [Burkholderia sp. FERM BP-3421]
MHTRHIQNFLMVSTAFFAMSGPARSAGASALAVAAMPQLQVVPAVGDIAVTGWAAPRAVRPAAA